MKRSEAPRPGWYPDPNGGARLRWWEGDDWSDRYRARPPDMRAVPYGQASLPGQAVPPPPPGLQQAAQYGQQYGQQYAGQYANQVDTAQIVEQVRRAAREEAQRASVLFGQQAKAAARNVAPLISEYTTKVTRVLRVLGVIAIVLLVLYVAFQVFAQQSLFDWIGDRIDNVTDQQQSGAVVRFVSG